MTVSQNMRKDLYRSAGAEKAPVEDVEVANTLEDKVNALAEKHGIEESTPKVQLSCYVDAEIAKAMKTYAHKTHQSMSSAVMKALRQFLQS